MPSTIAAIRKDYMLKALLEKDVDANAIRQFDKWWQEAIESEIDEVNAMTLATASADGVPSARIVLLKAYSPQGFVFFTNYESFKGQQLLENPKACLVFFWKELERQVRITGLVQRVDASDSDEYFSSRPEGSQLGAIVSPQSRSIESREWLEKKLAEAGKQFAGQSLQRPNHWGGFIVKPVVMEFWQGRPSRLHDRLEYTLQDDGNWTRVRLAP